MKKTIAFVGMIVLIMSLIPFNCVYAAGQPTIFVETSALDSNNEFDAVVSVKDNTGIAFFSLQASFDNAKLQLVSTSQGQLRGVTLPNASALAKANTDGVAAFSWVDADGFSSDSSLFSMRFKKVDGATDSAKITLKAGSGGIFDSNMKDIASKIAFLGANIDLGSSSSGTDNTTGSDSSTGGQPSLPAVDTIPEKDVKDALESKKPLVKIAEGASTIISKKSLQDIKKSGKSLSTELPSGVVVTIDPSSITDKAREADLNVKITVVVKARMVDGIPAPDHSIVIKPPEIDDFGFSMSVKITARQVADAGISVKKAKLVRIDDKGIYTDATGSITVNDDGSITVGIKHALGYVLSEKDLVAQYKQALKKAGRTTGSSTTSDKKGNVVLWVCAGGLVVVGIIAAVVIWRRRKPKRVS